MSACIAIPVKSFDAAKARLGTVLTARQREQLGRAMAERTLAAALGTGADVAIVTADPAIGAWADGSGAAWVKEADGVGSGLDRAAQAAVAASDGRTWMVVHADLPLIRPVDLERAVAAIPADGYMVSPSYDGGTSAIGGGLHGLRFSFGPGSFHRHLAQIAAGPHRIHWSTRLALDIDGPHDLYALRRLPGGEWLDELLSTVRRP